MMSNASARVEFLKEVRTWPSLCDAVSRRVHIIDFVESADGGARFVFSSESNIGFINLNLKKL